MIFELYINPLKSVTSYMTHVLLCFVYVALLCRPHRKARWAKSPGHLSVLIARFSARKQSDDRHGEARKPQVPERQHFLLSPPLLHWIKTQMQTRFPFLRTALTEADFTM